MKYCSKCKVTKDSNAFNKNQKYCRECEKARLRIYRATDKGIIAQFVYSSRSRAKKLGYEHDITTDDLYLPTNCPILGVKLDLTKGSGYKQYAPSIDRIDSSKGYVKGNVWIMSALANRMKQEATPEQLRAFATGILNNPLFNEEDA